MRVLIMPTGITIDTVRGIFSKVRPDHVIAAYIDDGKLVDRKMLVLNTLKVASELSGADISFLPMKPNTGDASRVYYLLKKIMPTEVYFSTMTGSRHAIVSLSLPIKMFVVEHKTRAYIITGVEGESEFWFQPLLGYSIVIDEITPAEANLLRVIDKIAEKRGEVSIKELMDLTGYTRSIYRILKGLANKGLIKKKKKGIIIETQPGKIVGKIINWRE